MTRLPNGNVLLIVWDRKTAEEAIAAGRRPEMTGDQALLPDSLVEIKPTGKTTGEVVWEWHLWDHLVQDFDKTKANYGDVAEHPELVDINFGEDELPVRDRRQAKDGKDKDAKAKDGQVRPTTSRRSQARPAHRSGLHPRQRRRLQRRARPDRRERHGLQRVLDHRPRHDDRRGGRPHRRPQRQGAATCSTAGATRGPIAPARRRTGSSSPSTTPTGSPRAFPATGHLLVFNNGGEPAGRELFVGRRARPPRRFARAILRRKPGKAYGPDQPVWSYTAPKKTDFYSSFISGAQRLPNGNTLICSGPTARSSR